MFYIILVTLASIFLVASQPIDILKTEPSDPTDEVVYVPYAVKYVPIEVPIKIEKGSKISKDNIGGLAEIDVGLPIEEIKILPIKTNPNETEINEDLKKPYSESSFNLFEDKFEADPSKSSEDYVLVPISVLKKLQDEANIDSSRKARIITKRQAPGNFGSRGLIRRPALVGYLNNYDLFPTVA